ncbi:MAG: LysO family transporter [Oscillospiraceae bacterium]|nr:LysO family transporter [Oscillospiraceae bacterium]
MIIMLAGVLVGLRFFPPKYNKINLRLQTVCTALLIFAMGVSLGSQPDFIEKISSIGLQSLVLALCGIALSTLLVWLFTRRWKQ